MTTKSLSHGLWAASAPEAPTTPALDRKIHVDVAVIGAGYTGLSAALHLAELGRSVAVLEAEVPGHGGSGRNVGLVNAGMWVMPDALRQNLGEDLGGRMLSFLGDGPSAVFDLINQHGIDCEATRRGTLHCAVGASGLTEISERARQWSALKAPVEVLAAKDAAEKLGTKAFEGALWDHRAGTVQPMAYVRGLCRAAMKAGAQVYGKSPVTEVAQGPDHWTLTTPTGKVHADWLIAATNVYTASVWPELATSQVVLPYFNMATAPLPADVLASILPERQGAWDTRSVLTSFRLDQAGRLIFGSVGQLGVEAAIHAGFSQRSLRAMYPQLGDVTFEYQWWGQIGMTPDNLPRLTKLGRNALAVSGYNGRGIAPGTVCGRALAHHIAGNLPISEIPLPVVDLTPDPMRAARGLGYRAGAAALHAVAQRV
ncbi:NAD(P)/FAD-dependent oxidoreductase [Donghicola mangrovi]|uniref:FAD-binding oxidoreductase n=1 Tax=Donghicola mangrovi TaxID=2729614 RepID=A0A850Q9C1_9RHOB|nr:FAD-binding oxidoreductase [Donghicola mangrovi]NVO25504.1 FAD-binding oxidoreductase [Donghicola mangrovi]